MDGSSVAVERLGQTPGAARGRELAPLYSPQVQGSENSALASLLLDSLTVTGTGSNPVHRGGSFGSG